MIKLYPSNISHLTKKMVYPPSCIIPRELIKLIVEYFSGKDELFIQSSVISLDDEENVSFSTTELPNITIDIFYDKLVLEAFIVDGLS